MFLKYFGRKVRTKLPNEIVNHYCVWIQINNFLGGFWKSKSKHTRSVIKLFLSMLRAQQLHKNVNITWLTATYVSSLNTKTRRYGPLCGPTSSSCGGLWSLAEAFYAIWAKKMSLLYVFAHFWQFLVPISNLGNF